MLAVRVWGQIHPHFLGVQLPGNLILETTDLGNSFQTLSALWQETELVGRTFGSLFPSLARIGHMATCSREAVWESEHQTFLASFMGGSACRMDEERGVVARKHNLPHFLPSVYI